MKSLKKFLTETTVPEKYHHIPDSWDHHSEVSKETHNKMDEALGGKSFTTFPLDASHVHGDVDVIEHLNNHGYHIKDYKNGIVSSKKIVGDTSKGIPLREKMVDEKIGAVLEKTNASPTVKAAFINDPARSNKSISEHHVCITTNPLGIAGASTGTNWNSCMNLNGGAYRSHLRDDSEHGTHVAYLVHKDDETAFKYGQPSNPLARISLKPFHSEHTEDTIFRPEGNSYGNPGTNFRSAVSEWAHSKYPAKTDELYTKNKHVYDDDGIQDYSPKTKEGITRAIHAQSPFAEKNESIDHHLIDHVVNTLGTDLPDETKSIGIRNAARLPNLTPIHVSKLYKMTEKLPYGGEMRHVLARTHGDKFSTSSINSYINENGVDSVPQRMVMSRKLPDEVVDKLTPSNLEHVHPTKIKPHHMDKVVDSYINNESGSSYPLSSLSHHFDSNHISKLILNKPSETVARIVTKNPNFTQDHHDALVSMAARSPDTTPSSTASILSSKFAKFSDAEKINSPSAYNAIKRNEHLPKEEYSKIANHLVKNFVGPETTQYFAPKIQATGMVHIPEKVGDAMTPAHFKALADNFKTPMFESPEHSNKMLDAIHSNILKADSDVSDLIEKKQEHDSDYEPDDDDDHNAFKDVLHKHIASYADQIDHHIGDHVEEDDSIKDHDEYRKTINRINKLGDLDNYMTPKNSNRYDDTEHYDDHFSGHVDKLASLADAYNNHHEDY